MNQLDQHHLHFHTESNIYGDTPNEKYQERIFQQVKQLCTDFLDAIRTQSFNYFYRDSSNPLAYTAFIGRATYDALVKNVEDYAKPYESPTCLEVGSGTIWTFLSSSDDIYRTGTSTQVWQVKPVDQSENLTRTVAFVYQFYERKRDLSKRYINEPKRTLSFLLPSEISSLAIDEVERYLKDFILKACAALCTNGFSQTIYNPETRELTRGTVDKLLDVVYSSKVMLPASDRWFIGADFAITELEEGDVRGIDVVQGFLKCFNRKTGNGTWEQMSINLELKVEASDILPHNVRNDMRNAVPSAFRMFCVFTLLPAMS